MREGYSSLNLAELQEEYLEELARGRWLSVVYLIIALISATLVATSSYIADVFISSKVFATTFIIGVTFGGVLIAFRSLYSVAYMNMPILRLDTENGAVFQCHIYWKGVKNHFNRMCEIDKLLTEKLNPSK